MGRKYRNKGNRAPRLICLVLVGLLITIQYPLWYGKGSERSLHDLNVQLTIQRQNNEKLQQELDLMQREADSLRAGKEAIESRARESMNMIKENEVLFRLSDEP
ncbi:MAG: septum formation initiator family protein [Burkholderiales bacterium]|nr:septum formation initiator family protein [Burkholderiales bacterium]